MTSQTQITFTVGLICLVLFVIAITVFCINFGYDNDAALNVADDEDISSFNSDSQVDLSEFKTESEETYSSILQTTVEPGSDVVQSSGPFAITAGNVLGTTKNIAYLPYKKIFGSGSGFGVFITSFVAILVFILALLIVKTWKGNP